MQISNPLQMNDWPIRKFLAAVIAVQVALWALIALRTIGLEVSILRHIVALVFLAYIPGVVILRILKLHSIGYIEALLYSVGLSVAFVMFSGALINGIYPLFGISKPISLIPLMISFTALISAFCVIAYIRDRNFSAPTYYIDAKGLLSSPVLFLLLLPTLSALGTRLVYLHQGNIVLLILLSLIALTAVLVAFSKFIPTKLYPLAIGAISISLIWHWSLIGAGLTGVDVHQEYYLQNLVLSNSVWDYTIPGTVNAMLSIMMMAPIYSLILNLDTVWLFKIFYPLFFSLVPLALFQAYRKQTGDKIAFLAAFSFMSMPVFFSTMTQLVRQQIAELFLALSILLFVNLGKEIATTKKTTLLIIFSSSIVVSHYGISYIYVLALLMALPLLILWRSSTVNELWEVLAKRFRKSRQGITVSHPSQPLPQGTPTVTYIIYVMLFVVVAFAWYMYVSSGLAFTSIAEVIREIYSNLITDFFRLGARGEGTAQALGLMAMRGLEVEWEIARIFQYLVQLFILVGILELIANWRKTRFVPVYAVLSLASIMTIAASIIIPNFTNHLGISRIYHIALLFLAPFSVLGGIAASRWLSHLLNRHRLQSHHTSLKLLVISLSVPYFLFSTGFIFEITGATPSSMPLSLYRVDWSVVTESETLSAKWLASVGEKSFVCYGDGYGEWTLFQEVEGRARLLPFDVEQISLPSYIFLRNWNIVEGELYLVRMVGGRSIQEWIDITGETDLGNALRERSKIYNNGWAAVLGP